MRNNLPVLRVMCAEPDMLCLVEMCLAEKRGAAVRDVCRTRG